MRPRQLLQIPLRPVTVPGSLLPGIRAYVPAFVRTVTGAYTAAEFRLDTGADFSEVGMAWANLHGVPFRGTNVVLPVVTGAGFAPRTGIFDTLHLRLPGWSGPDLKWSCFFRQNRPAPLPEVLGLGSMLGDVRLQIDPTPGPGAGLGYLILEER